MVKAQRSSCSSGGMPAYSERKVMKEYRSERRGWRNFDTALHNNAVDVIATEETRTAKAAVRATHYDP
jgi:hypothetical protein